MSQRTYICLDCRTAKRAEAAYGLSTEFRCPQCQCSLFELPWRWRIPKKNDDAEWKKLSQMVVELRHEWLPRRQAQGESLLADLDKAIEATSRQRNSETKESKLKYLRWKRREIVKGYTEQAVPTDAGKPRR